ncbi:hypothetical protein ELI44_17035 [Rhizobium ruizarguesonis]|uniref:Uncharacterized protein n=1 Tax=Rhizobium leguminosarum TaxID=384 RepID=A0A2K9Z787_RHILE|nr:MULTISPECIES: hypothetical protein [Rhizobium]AUW44040.1 hypothetical protein CUJ84_Chr003709 [Rhizobium leguminosarum]MBY2962071.1 hypothetical protein [Rhizobium leguminosarum]TAU49613.1 hypothetical protein ELI42_16995 [Rhizobium ruizarguesonis]TAU64686.1 hypothetical protein ELI44_17035 [Rhizobium ruizarguesonis]
MLSSMHILSLKQGKLYGDRIPIEALPQGLPQHLVVLFSLIGRWRERTKKGPAEAGPEVAGPQQAASVA